MLVNPTVYLVKLYYILFKDFNPLKNLKGVGWLNGSQLNQRVITSAGHRRGMTRSESQLEIVVIFRDGREKRSAIEQSIF